MSSPSTSRSGSSSRPRSSSDSPPGTSGSARDKDGKDKPTSAASSQPSRTGSASASSSRQKSAGSGAGTEREGKSGKKKKGSKSSKKKKKKPIVEDPRLVRELLARVENGNITVDELRHKLDSTEYNNKYDFNQSAGEIIVMAAIKGRLDIIKFLYEERKANMNVMNGKPLQRASLYGQYEIVDYLTTPSPFGTIPPAADLHMPSIFAEYLPLHYAAQNGNVDLVKLLIQRGAKLDATCNMETCGIYNGWSALHFAADHPHMEIVKLLVESGASVDVKNANGDTPLGIAAERGHWTVAKYLVASGAELHVYRRGLNIVQWACYRADQDAVQFLVSYGAKPLLDNRAIWFPANKNLKEIIYEEFSEAIYDQIDLAIYRGGKQLVEREKKKIILRDLKWEYVPPFDPYAINNGSGSSGSSGGMGSGLGDELLYSPSSAAAAAGGGGAGSSSSSQASSPTGQMGERSFESRLSGRHADSAKAGTRSHEKQLRSFPEQIVQLISAYEM